MKDWYSSTALAGLGAIFLAGSPAQAIEAENPDDLLNLSLEQLSNIEVTSVSKRSEKASEAAAAIYVITQDDIRQSGLTSIPELLRMVPGLNVAQSGSHQWAISARGSNDQFANKLLVLIDGRTVYTPLFSGVFWDTQDVVTEDIERIEVIRGPGATLWGANAVNGVINIITKNAKDTQGGILSVSSGNLNNALLSARYGRKVGENVYVRSYVKRDDYNHLDTLTNTTAKDAWSKSQAGFRADWANSENQSFTLQGDLYHAKEKNPLNVPLVGAPFVATVKNDEMDVGGNILGRWDNKISDISNLTVQVYYDLARRDNYAYANRLDTFDIDLQHIWTPITAHEIVWGIGYRLIKSDTENTGYIQLTPAKRSDNLYSAFIQDKIAILPEELFLTLGSKFEHNEFTGFEMQPSARFSWLVNEKQTIWGAVSRAVRTPNIAQADLQLVVAALGGGALAARVGSSSESEELVAYELGYRIQPTRNTSLDIAGFYNDYSRLILGLQGTPFGPVTLPILGAAGIAPVLPINAGTAQSWGIETAAKWNPTSTVELSAGYTLLQLKFDQTDPYGFSFGGKSPEQQFNIRSNLQLPYNVEFNTALYYVDHLTALSPSSGRSVPDYTRLDMKLSWEPLDNIEVSLVGQNLLDKSHPEFAGFLYQADSQIPRSFYGNITWKF